MNDALDARDPVADAAFLSGGGEMGARMRAFDWRSTPLGPPGGWPQSLKTIVRVMLDSRYAMWMLWGPELTFFCNDAYLPTVGLKRDWVLGARSDRVWEEIWPDIGPRIRRVLDAGEATWDEGLQLFLERRGFAEETYHTFSYSPVYDDRNRIAGMLCVVTEVTDGVIGERRLGLLQDLAARSASTETTLECCRRLCRVLSRHPLDVPFADLYLVDATSGRSSLVASTRAADADSPLAAARLEPLLGEMSAPSGIGRPVVIDGLSRHGLRLDIAGWNDPVERALLLPLRSSAADRVAGFLLAGVSPRRPFDDDYRAFLELAAGQVASAIGDTQAYESERRRAEALAELDRAKTAFFSNISHELRTPLTLIIGPSESALASASPVLAGDDLERLHRNALRLLKLVNSLLDFSRIEAGRVQATFRPTDLAALTRDVASTFRSAMERAGLAFEVRCEGLPLLYVDREMWEKIVLNLLSNALKYTLAGHVRVRLVGESGHAELQVEDSGSGVPEAELPHLFERFHRVEGTVGRTSEGSGIGLALVQELVSMHGGTIEVASRVGVGTTFRVRLPFGAAHLPAERVRAEAAATSTPAVAQPYVQEALGWFPDARRGAGTEGLSQLEAPAADRRFASTFGARVVLADDNADLRDYVRDLLAGSYEVEAVADGEAALAAIRRRRADLVVSDVMMPRLDGFGLVAAIRADPALRATPIILVSARAGEESRIEGFDAGADDYLVKPFSARELLARVGALLERDQMRRSGDESLRVGLSSARMVVWDWSLANGSMVFSENVREVLGGEWSDIASGLAVLHPEDRARHVRALSEAIDGGGTIDTDVRIVRPDSGEVRWMQVRGRVHAGASGRPVRVSGATIDVTDLHRAEERLRDADRRKDEFLAMLAHELRNPLAPIRHAAGLLARLVTHDGRARAAIGVVERQVGQLTRLVDDLLDVSRITRGRITLERRTVDLRGVLSQALETVEPLLRERRLDLEVRRPETPLCVDGDAARLVQCVVNLLTNAAKFTDPDGRILVQLATDGGEARLDITDTGIGIPPPLLPQVFDLFVQGDRTLDRSQGGLGIGLSVVRRLVDMHGGRVSAHSEGAGRGSTFTLRLPLAASLAEVAPSPPSAQPAPQRVLVVDDNHDAANSLVMLLKLMGHEARAAYSGPQALERLDAAPEAPDVVLLDIGLPGMDGYEVARRVRAQPRHAGLRLVALTGYGQAADRALALDAGFDEHLVKPVDLDLLAQALEPAPGR